jgi:Putative Actinobacterial Holin-X, holin superfamily III
VFSLLMLGFAFAAVAAGFATFLPTWAALLITTGILAALTGLLGLLALGRIQRGAPPVPEQAIQEARLTTNVLKR